MKFTLPEVLPESKAELVALLAAAEAEFDEIAGGVNDEGSTVSAETLADMRALNEASQLLTSKVQEIDAAETQRVEEARALIEARKPVVEDEPTDEPTDDDGGTEVVAEAEQVAADAAKDKEAVAASGAKPASFKGLARSTGKTPAKVIDQAAPSAVMLMTPGANKYKAGPVTYSDIGRSIDSMSSGAMVRSNRDPVRGKTAVSLATIDRGLRQDQIVDDQESMVAAIEAATDWATQWQKPKYDDEGAEAAAGGWCAPSLTLYDFCDVPPASDLISLPEVNLTRPGLRWPAEPDFTELYAVLPFRFTEAELVVDPPVVKPCVEIPCVDDFTEIRPEAVGLCITAGILQKRGWPELIARFVAEATKAHLHAMSRITILDMVAGSTAVTFTDATTFGAVGSVLNSLALEAVNIRLQERMPSNARIEGVAPSWLREQLRADLTYQEGAWGKAVTDADIDRWLALRGIYLQYVGDWQTRAAGKPGFAPSIVAWPNTVQVLLYPAGAWFRHISNVIEVGTLYDKAQLQINRYTELFTEDEYFTAKRCRTSKLVTIPICANGYIGDRFALSCAGVDVPPAP